MTSADDYKSIVHDMDSLSFQYVDRRLSKKNGKRRKNVNNISRARLVPESPEGIMQVLEVRRLTMRKFDWLSLSTTWLSNCLVLPSAPRSIRRVICLALGSFSPPDKDLSTGCPESASIPTLHGLKQSQYQLVFLLDVIIPTLTQLEKSFGSSTHQADLSECPTIPGKPDPGPIMVSMYDPAFTQKDKEILHGLGHTVLDEEPDLTCTEPTYFYMPHAPKTLYDKLICKNLKHDSTPGNIANVMILGNNLNNYRQAMTQAEKSTTPSLLFIDESAIETHCPPDLAKLDKATGVHFFNEICLQWFTGSSEGDATS